MRPPMPLLPAATPCHRCHNDRPAAKLTRDELQGVMVMKCRTCALRHSPLDAAGRSGRHGGHAGRSLLANHLSNGWRREEKSDKEDKGSGAPIMIVLMVVAVIPRSCGDSGPDHSARRQPATRVPGRRLGRRIDAHRRPGEQPAKARRRQGDSESAQSRDGPSTSSTQSKIRGQGRKHVRQPSAHQDRIQLLAARTRRDPVGDDNRMSS